MSVQIILRTKKYSLPPGKTLKESLLFLGLNPESYLAVKNGEMITDDTCLKQGDQIKLIAVISGG